MKIENHLIGCTNPKSTPRNITLTFTRFIENRISELEKQLSEKNTIRPKKYTSSRSAKLFIFVFYFLFYFILFYF